MKVLKLAKDGGPLSRVWGFYIFEIKSLASVVLIHFLDGSREAYHSHAFGAISWVLKGRITERTLDGKVNVYTPSIKPIVTPRSMFHKVVSDGDTWALSLRGPWARFWCEYLPESHQFVTLTHGRRIVR